jgi:hypothetical protein
MRYYKAGFEFGLAAIERMRQAVARAHQVIADADAPDDGNGPAQVVATEAMTPPAVVTGTARRGRRKGLTCDRVR